jgi:hypothetical protein
MTQLFTNTQIQQVVLILKEHRCYLYHACQLTDLSSYCRVGGIPSRAHLTQLGLPFTPFATDKIDKVNRVWDNVFLNLSDFGHWFAAGNQNVPNPYGPILLKLKPEILLPATDVAISLRSAGATGFDRDAESLSTIEEVQKLFAPNGYVKFKETLRTDFKNDKASSPEMSCTAPLGFLPFAGHLLSITVDPYTFDDEYTLTDAVQHVLNRELGEKMTAQTRTVQEESGRSRFYDEIVTLMNDFGWDSNQWVVDEVIPTEFSRWLDTIKAGDLNYQLRRYARYLYVGTFQPIEAKSRAIEKMIDDRMMEDMIAKTRPGGYSGPPSSNDEMVQDWGFEDWEDFSQSRD